MKVLDTATMPNGTDIRIEEWHENYDFMPYGRTIAAYPISKVSHEGPFAPRGNERYRFSFDFENAEKCKEAFELLKAGKVQLIDYVDKINKKKYADCI